MKFPLSAADQLARARSDLRLAVPVRLQFGDQIWIAAAIETLTAARFAAFQSCGRPFLALTARRAETLKARPYDGDMARIQLPRDVDLSWVQSVADPAGDLLSPMKGPLESLRDGPADPARAALALCKAARLLPAALMVQLADAAAEPDLTLLDTDSARAALTAPVALSEIVSASVPLQVAERARLHLFRAEDGGEDHYAIEIGQPDRAQPVLTRLHSACFTGDIIGSLKCDCGPQLRGALERIGAEGSGVLLYLNQEGRGIGLANKMRAYSLQDQGFDTVEANHRLGFEDDERDFRIGAQILSQMGFASARLMTNNPAKLAMLERCGLTVTERVPLQLGRTAFNAAYLDTKASKSGHLL
ncbi:MAG: GTP cyclohydrolase II [Mangrovicoccus sp.]